MAIKLRQGEEIKAQVDLHWSVYLLPGVWAFLWTPGIIVALFTSRGGQPPILLLAILGYVPLVYRFLQNKCKAYVITNERLYVEEGILAKSKKDIPLDKINDFEINQGLLQRIFEAGNIHVLTGNSKATKMTNIADVETFREAASSLIASRKVS